MPPTTAPRSSSAARSWPRSSRRVRTRVRVPGGTRCLGRRVVETRAAGAATWAEPDVHASPAGRPTWRSGGRRRGLRCRPARRRARLDGLGPSRAARARAPGRPAAQGRTAACRPPGAGRPAGGRPSPGQCPRRSSARPAAARRRSAPDRRPAGRGRARAGPSAGGAGGRTSRSRSLSADQQRERAGRRVRAGRDVEGDDGVAELGLVGRRRPARSRRGGRRRAAARRAAPASASTAVGERRRRVADVGAEADVRSDASVGHVVTSSTAARLRAMNAGRRPNPAPGAGPDAGPLERWVARRAANVARRHATGFVAAGATTSRS